MKFNFLIDNIIKTDRLILRKWSKEDAKYKYKFSSSISDYTTTGCLSVNSIKEAEEIIEGYIESNSSLAIVIDENTLIGELHFVYMVTEKSEILKQNIIDVGFYLDAEYRKKGLMTEALTVIFDKIFCYDKNIAITAGYIEENKNCKNLLNSLGFIEYEKYNFYNCALNRECEITNSILNYDTWLLRRIELKCPVCQQKLKRQNKVYKCHNGHSFDISKKGYINLLLNNSGSHGDNKIMITARHNFLEKNYYISLKNKINEILSELILDNMLIVDCGCADLWYDTEFIYEIDKFFSLLGMDISKDAINIASNRHLRGILCVASAADIPLCNNSCDVLISNFAPIYESEANRVIKQNGYIIKIIPGKKHLYELKNKLYEHPYKNSIDYLEFENFVKISEYNVTDIIIVKNEDIKNLISMTPYFYTTSLEAIEKLLCEEELSTTIEFIISIYKKQ